jgi:hypothetical protein
MSSFSQQPLAALLAAGPWLCQKFWVCSLVATAIHYYDQFLLLLPPMQADAGLKHRGVLMLKDSFGKASLSHL